MKRTSADDRKPTENTHTVQFENAKWAAVFDWYAGVTQLMAVAIAKPEGTFPLKHGKDRQFTPAEITDLLNEELMKQNMMLIPNRKTFAVVSSKEKIDPKLMPVVELTDLPKLAKTALSEVTIPLATDVDEAVTELKKLLTPFGELSAKGKSVVVRDTMGNLLRITRT